MFSTCWLSTVLIITTGCLRLVVRDKHLLTCGLMTTGFLDIASPAALFSVAMKSSPNIAPVFALDETTDWEDLENDMTASADYQARKLGKIIPLMFFAPMTTPENLDAWEPVKTPPDNLLIVSMERSADNKLIKAIELAEPELGELKTTSSFPAVQVDYEKPLASVYQQMQAADIAAYAQIFTHPDAPSFFFLRGNAGVLAFNRALRQVTK